LSRALFAFLQILERLWHLWLLLAAEVCQMKRGKVYEAKKKGCDGENRSV